MIGKFYKLQKTYSKKITPEKSLVVRMHFFGQMSDWQMKNIEERILCSKC